MPTPEKRLLLQKLLICGVANKLLHTTNGNHFYLILPQILFLARQGFLSVGESKEGKGTRGDFLLYKWAYGRGSFSSNFCLRPKSKYLRRKQYPPHLNKFKFQKMESRKIVSRRSEHRKISYCLFTISFSQIDCPPVS